LRPRLSTGLLLSVNVVNVQRAKSYHYLSKSCPLTIVLYVPDLYPP
jgi:hypothetical protein